MTHTKLSHLLDLTAALILFALCAVLLVVLLPTVGVWIRLRHLATEGGMTEADREAVQRMLKGWEP